MPQPPENFREFSSLIAIVEALRGPDGCPWDKAQTHKTLTRNAVEETYELVEAIDNDDRENIIEELGDVLLQVVLHAEIARQDKNFDIHDVIEGISDKLVRRHTHVFGDNKADNSDQAMASWNAAKDKEKKNSKPKTDRVFDIPLDLPALLKSEKIGMKSTKYNFDWPSYEPVMEKVKEEWGEVQEAIASKDKEHMEHEIGDLLFSVAQLARHLDINPEQSLRNTNRRFEKRFARMREIAKEKGLQFEELDTETLEGLWTQAKKDLA